MRVLILAAAAGGGHIRTARALEQYIRCHAAQAQVKVVDALKEVNRAYDKLICGGYHFVATKMPGLFGHMYHNTNGDSPLAKLVPKLNAALSKRLLPQIHTFQPDIIVTTHPFAAEMVSHLKEKGMVCAKLLVIITDYAPHKTWITAHADGYIVANDDMAMPMVQDFGVEPEKIHAFGIPVLETFFHSRPKEDLRREMELAPDVPTLLLMAGSFGVDTIMQIYRDIIRIPLDLQIIVITGKNQRLYRALKTTTALSLKKTKLIYFTQHVEQYMQASDLLITKPGGLTVTEALASNLPMLVFEAIPGQEEDNADFLELHKMAKRIHKNESCAAVVKALLENRAELTAMEQACRRFDQSDGCAKTVAFREAMVK